jgi:cytochrome c peroxidase
LRADIANTLKSALAAQAIFPLVDHDEMRGQKGSNPIANAKDEHEAWDLLVEKILQIKDYKKLFEEVFPDEKINIGHFGEALAEFQSHNFFFSDTPYDRYIKGDKSALTLNQKKGMDVFFNKGKCGDCHQGEHLSLFDFDNVAAPQIGPGKDKGDDYGRYQWDNDENSRYGFRVTPLRNVALTAPYFHSGSLKTIEDVVEHYNDIKKSLDGYKISGQLENYVTPLKDHNHQTNELRLSLLPEDLPLKLNLSQEEKNNLVDFLKFGLTDLRLHGNIK